MPDFRIRPDSSVAKGGLGRIISGRQTLIFSTLVGLGLAAALLLRFVQDDAFISFSYARNLVEGQGLTWFGTRVEGYSNFLWVIWVAVGIKLGINPIAWAWLWGLVGFTLGLYCTWRLALRLFGDPRPALLTLLLLITNYSVLCYATGGLETAWATCLLTLGVLLGLCILEDRHLSRAHLGAASVVAAAGVLTHPDMLLPMLILAVAATAALSSRRASLSAYCLLWLPFALIIGSWLAWKTAYYGTVLPNTWYAKVRPSPATLRTGVLYLLRFLHWYLLWPVALAGVVVTIWRPRPGANSRRQGTLTAERGTDKNQMLDAKAGRNLLLLLLIVVARAAYLILVGGDFMEFRAWVPILPLAFLLLAYLTWYQLGAHLFRRPTLVAGLVVTVLTAASVHHALKFRGLTEDRTLDSIETLATFYGVYPDRKWDRIGNALGTQLQSLDVRIALTAVGAIPYYSRIPTTDMLGLTDREVARHGKPAPADYPRPGHQRHARISYLIEQRVNLVIGHPTLAWRGLLASPQARRYIESWFPIAVPYGQEPFVNPVMVLMPVTRERGLLMWYLTPSPELDQVIRQNGWELLRTDLVLPVEEGR